MDLERNKFHEFLEQSDYGTLAAGSVINQCSLISGTPYLDHLSFVIETDLDSGIRTHPK